MIEPLAENTPPFVFHDPQGRRWPRMRRVLVLLGVMIFVGVVLFVQALFVSPQLRLPDSSPARRRSGTPAQSCDPQAPRRWPRLS